ncbi:hypothetical protein [Pedobacter sp.]|uniref:hypothetical protein n=1 Tax=Pedobacter sp. TaxID=1411316 RepID=UPI003D7F6673
MKQSFLLLLCIATLGLASCKKENIYYETPNRTFNYTIQKDEWVLDESVFNYTVNLNIPELDQVTLDDEGLLVYINHPINENSYIQVPYTYDTEAYSYELYNGGIAIDAQRSGDINTAPIKPERTIKVKIVLIPSTFVP